ncbi:sodium:solute symporter [Cytophagaceae bacterium ABcell3]|nr:sodium:solute symporter [Cytophagaceae bacterium ABcell3]
MNNILSTIDWVVLLGTLLFIVFYGAFKHKASKNMEGYLMGDHDMKWYTIGLSVMATQASAITFLSTPGQAYIDGMGFVQFYFGLPLAMVFLSIFVLPIYYRLKVYTAYEFLENRFDLNTRLLAAFLFLLQRGLAAGITIYAPAIILSSILNWPLNLTNLLIGILVIIYTVSGGTKAVSQTQKQQMAVIFAGMVVAFSIIVSLLPDNVSFGGAMEVAGTMGKLETIDFSIDLEERYTFWSGITGGLFLALAYFGTDQSQVQRYLSGRSVTEGRLGLLFNGMLKIPMQFFILLTGVMVFVFYQFVQPPVHFNDVGLQMVRESAYADSLKGLEQEYQANFERKKADIEEMLELSAIDAKNAAEEKKKVINKYESRNNEIREQVKGLISSVNPDAETKDADYIFVTFIINYLPTGVIGLLLAVIFSAAMSSTAGELNALGSTTIVDFYKRVVKPDGSDQHYLMMSKLFTACWGFLAIGFAFFASLVDNLIQAVNILGSIFYGTILGIFVVAFFFKWVKGLPVFIAAIISQIFVIVLYWASDIGFLWFNAFGCLSVMLLSTLISFVLKQNER